MRRLPRAAWLAAFLALSLVGLAACSDDGDEGSSQAEFKVTPLEALKSYRFTSEILVASPALDPQTAASLLQGGTFRIKSTGIRVSPDRQQATIDADLGFLKTNIETISIAKNQWSRESGGQWQQGVPGTVSVLATSDFSPQGLFYGSAGPDSEQLTARLAGRPFTQETLAGVAARHYVLTPQGFREVFGTQNAVPETATDVTTQAEVWFSEERGVLLRVLISGKDAQQKDVLRVDVQVSDIDGASNQVEPPI